MENNYQNYYNPQPYGVHELEAKVSATMKRVYVKMFLALLVTAFVAMFCAQSEGVIGFFAANRWAMWVLVFAELGIVIGVSGGINKLSTGTATMLFYLFAVINGLMLFPILLAFTGVSVAKTFFITAGVFGAMSVYGYFTTQDLTKWGSFLFMALIGLIICSVVNIFLRSTTMEWIGCRSADLHWSHSMGYPADQGYGTADAGRFCRQARYSRRAESLSRFHQPVPLSAPFLRQQPRLIADQNRYQEVRAECPDFCCLEVIKKSGTVITHCA